MELGDCDVYSCVPDFEGDPFADRGSMYVFFRILVCVSLIFVMEPVPDSLLMCVGGVSLDAGPKIFVIHMYPNSWEESSTTFLQMVFQLLFLQQKTQTHLMFQLSMLEVNFSIPVQHLVVIVLSLGPVDSSHSFTN